MILVDTSIWIDHLHQGEPRLVALLNRNEVLSHPLVTGELALGSLADRDTLLSLLAHLPHAASASDAEILAFIEAQALYSRGLSLVDVHLLAATRLTPAARLWTRDRRLLTAAEDLDLAVAENTLIP